MPFDRSDPRSTFERAAERYVTSPTHGDHAALQRLVRLAEPKGGALLDVATGSGHTALAFAPHVDSVTATDITSGMLAVCRREARSRGLKGLRVCFAQAMALPFRSTSFDAATCRIAPHHFPNVGLFVREVFRVLRKGGWFLLVDTVSPENPELAREIDAIESARDPSHVKNLSMSEWERLLTTTGFSIRAREESSKTMDLHDWLDRTDVVGALRREIQARIEGSEGEVRKYLQPDHSGDRSTFQLREGLFLADK